jgi:hypothetical protein
MVLTALPDNVSQQWKFLCSWADILAGWQANESILAKQQADISLLYTDILLCLLMDPDEGRGMFLRLGVS